MRHLVAFVLALVVLTGLVSCVSTTARRGPGGRALFVEACGACHTISGRPDPTRQGGDLRDLHVSHDAMLQFIREMPVRHPLRAKQLQAIAHYVLSVEDRSRESG